MAKQLRFIPIVLWTVVICYLSFSQVPKLEIKPPIGIDKVAHIFMYAILMWFCLSAQVSKFQHTILIVFAFTLAGTTELVQHYFVKNRVGDWFDFIANCIGLVVVFWWMKKNLKT